MSLHVGISSWLGILDQSPQVWDSWYPWWCLRFQGFQRCEYNDSSNMMESLWSWICMGLPWLQWRQSFFKGWPPIYLVQRLVQERFPLVIRIILMILVAKSDDQGFHAYKIDKFQSIRSTTMVEINNMFHIIIFDQWLQYW